MKEKILEMICLRQRLEKFLLLAKQCESLNDDSSYKQNLILKMRKKYEKYFHNFDFKLAQVNSNAVFLTKLEFKLYKLLFKYFDRDKLLNFTIKNK